MSPEAISTAAPPEAVADRYRRVSVQLKAASAFVMGFGLLISLGAHETTDGPLRFFGDLYILPFGQQGVVTDNSQLLAAILGGVMVGWGLLYWLLTTELLPSQPALLRRLIMISIAAWFVIDCLGSLIAHSWINVISNIAFAAMFVIPVRRL